MSYPNPTKIEIGMEGTFAGKKYRVAGRAVLGIVEGGQVYFWQEYNLETDGASPATLVFEDNEEGPQWKIFTMFEPQFPISAEDAASKRSGDLINLEGANCRVVRVDHSRVYYVEGKAPEGEASGSGADYFNAVEKGRMIVVSWTGDEVECYRGMNLTSGMVASAFNLQGRDLIRFHLRHAAKTAQANGVVMAAIIIATALMLFSFLSGAMPMRRAPGVRVYKAPSASFQLSGAGTLNGTAYRTTARVVAEVQEVGLRWQRHEYYLAGDDGSRALLVEGMEPGTNDWVLFTSLSPEKVMTPTQAAEVIAGQIVDVGSMEAVAKELFRSRVQTVDGSSGESPVRAGEVRYGFLARRNTTLLMVRWNADEITYWQGTPVTGTDIKAAFGATGK